MPLLPGPWLQRASGFRGLDTNNAFLMAQILIIDDDPDMRAMLEQTLQSAGHEVTMAANGNQGLEVQCAKPASLIITDLLMPEKDGLETIIDFRRGFPKVPIIAISGR